MKGYNDFAIGDTVLFNGEKMTIKDYTVKKLHKVRNDQRTKLVDTVIWCLFNEAGHEYRQTSEQLKTANARRVSK